ncbi:hypothetical protein [Sphingopyxis chilensis]
MIAMFSRALRLGLAALALVLAALAAPASQAGVTKGPQTVNGLTIHLGIVPAAVARGHGGVPDRSMHNVHMVVAVFNALTGARITNATVVVHIIEPGGKQWSVPLEPMTVNGTLTYDGYATFVKASDYWIGVQVQRPPHTRQHPVTAHFTYAHD